MRQLVVIYCLLLCGCAVKGPFYQPAPLFEDRPEWAFSTYTENARQHIAQHRTTADPARLQQEVEWNAPFERRPAAHCDQQPGKSVGLLLAHGLSDSPFVFHDLAEALSERCIWVRALLLSGHGTQPSHLVDAHHQQWLDSVRFRLQEFQQQVDEVYLGGFSLGGALATQVALENDEVAGLVLLAPALELTSIRELLWLAPVAASFKNYLWNYEQSNGVKYESFATNAAVQVCHVRRDVQRLIARREYHKPVFVAASEADSIIDAEYLLTTFDQHWRHPDSRLVFYRNQVNRPLGPPEDARVQLRNSFLPQQNVLEFSHMALTNAPDNPVYGIGGFSSHCYKPNGLSPRDCFASGQVYYSAYRSESPTLVTSRLTYNPDFQHMVATISRMLRRDQVTQKQPMVSAGLDESP